MITVLSQAFDVVRRKFSRGELSMLIDIFNGTMLNPVFLGRHVVVQVEDSFSLYPGMYEEKWSVEKDGLVAKIKALSTQDAALIELWATTFWNINDHVGLEDYISGRASLATIFPEILDQLKKTIDVLEKTKSSFHSKDVARARAELIQVHEVLDSILSR